jgi:hypothetical protein
LEDLNVVIAEQLKAYNAAPFQKREGSRAEVFEAIERECLVPLPASPYEICQWVYGRSVNLDFHVVYKTNRYSVPYKLVGSKVDLKITDTLVEIFDRGTRVASHPRFPDFMHYKPSTSSIHMPPEFTNLEWDDERMRRWAKSIGANTLCVVERLFDGAQIKEQAYNSVMAILNLSKTYGDNRLEAACSYALEKVPSPRCRFLKTVLASNTDKASPSIEPPKETGGYVRGSSYYSTPGQEEQA